VLRKSPLVTAVRRVNQKQLVSRGQIGRSLSLLTILLPLVCSWYRPVSNRGLNGRQTQELERLVQRVECANETVGSFNARLEGLVSLAVDQRRSRLPSQQSPKDALNKE
jgi:hypothetical protein